MASSCLPCYKLERQRGLSSLRTSPWHLVCRSYLLWNTMRTPTHSMLTFTARHATSRDPRVSHLKNQLAELIASSPLLPKSRRSLSENARREFIHHTHQCSSPHRSLSSISSDHSETVNNSRLPGEEPVSLLTSDLPPIELPPTLDMLILQ